MVQLANKNAYLMLMQYQATSNANANQYLAVGTANIKTILQKSHIFNYLAAKDLILFKPLWVSIAAPSQPATKSLRPDWSFVFFKYLLYNCHNFYSRQSHFAWYFHGAYTMQTHDTNVQ